MIHSLKIVLMRTDNHQVRANVELTTGRTIFRLPGAKIHVRDADAINLRCSAGKAVLDPAQEYRIEAPRFRNLVRINQFGYAFESLRASSCRFPT